MTRTKNLLVLGTIALTTTCSMAQLSGNSNYLQPQHITENIITPVSRSSGAMTLKVSGINNVKPDAFVAIFNLKQAASDMQAVDKALNSRVTAILSSLDIMESVSETYLDMISFTPLYETEVTKKLFSKDTYNEVPAGFEVQKNLHIKFTDSKVLDKIITVCAASEVYDLVQVNYYIEDMEKVRRDLIDRTKLMMQDRLKDYETTMGESFTNDDRKVYDGFTVYYPMDRYKSCSAQQGTQLYYKTSVGRKSAGSSSMYYHPLADRQFDFNINPVILEPVVQVVYEMQVQFTDQPQKPGYFWLTPQGGQVFIEGKE